MANTLTVIVAAVPSLVTALQSTGQFASVINVASTAGLRDLLTSGQLSNTPKDKVFIFAEDTPVDTSLTLQALISKLVSMGSPVVVIGTSMAGRALVQECPGAGLLEGPLLLNQVLGAISGYPGVPQLSPVNPNIPIDLPGMPAPASSPFGQAPQTPQPAQAPQTPPAPQIEQPAAGPFGGAPQAPFGPANESPSPAAGSPFGSDTPSSPFGGNAPAVQPEPANAPQASADNPFNTSQAGTPFGASTADSPFGNAQSDSPFGAGSSAGGSPFGGNEPATPFGGNEQAGPFGGPSAQTLPAADTPASTTQNAGPFGTPGTPGQQVTDGPFGGAGSVPESPSPSGSPFGDSEPASPFGSPAPGAQADQAGQSPFGEQPTSSANAGPFGGGGQPFLAVDTVEQEPPYGAPRPREGAATGSETQRRGFVITVATPKGGTGKSSMSLNLAAYLGLRLRLTGRNVCMIDANVGQADTGKYLNVWTPNVEDILRDPAAIHPDRIQNHLAHFPNLNMSALLGPIQPEAANPLLFTGEKYTEILNAIKPHYDYIIIDTPEARFHSSMLRDFALPNADFVVVVVTPNNITLMNTELWLSAITDPTTGSGVERDRVGVVLNRAEDDIGVDEEEVRRELGEWRFLGAVPETKEWKRANNENRLVATSNYHELNQAFSIVLQSATGEDLISPGSAIEPVKTGLLDRFGRLLRRGDRK